MALPRLSNLEMRILEALWKHGPSSTREIQKKFPAKKRPAYTTIQTVVYRLETKGALRRTKRIATAHVFEPAISRDAARRRLIDDFLSVFGGEAQPVMMRLIETRKLTLEDIQDAEKALRRLIKKKEGL